MNIKEILFTKLNTAEFLDGEYKEPGDNEVLVKTTYTALSCGTEKATITAKTSAYDDGKFPRDPGYSGVGTVLKKGKDVVNVEVGDRVVVIGPHRNYITIKDSLVIKIPFDEISSKEAAFSYISCFPIAALRKVNLEVGESLGVIGLGILGIISVMLARVMGAYPVIGVDPVEERREMALRMGADYVFDPTEPDFVDKVKAVTDGGLNTAIEVTGIGKGLEQVLDCMQRFGRISLLGCTRNPNFTIDYYKKIHIPGITIVGASTAARPDFESRPGFWTYQDDVLAVLKLLHGKRISFKEFTKVVSDPMDANDIYTRLINDPHFPIATIFKWNDVE